MANSFCIAYLSRYCCQNSFGIDNRGYYLLIWLAALVHVQMILEEGAQFWSDTKLQACQANQERKIKAKTLKCDVPNAGVKIMTPLNFIMKMTIYMYMQIPKLTITS